MAIFLISYFIVSYTIGIIAVRYLYKTEMKEKCSENEKQDLKAKYTGMLIIGGIFAIPILIFYLLSNLLFLEKSQLTNNHYHKYENKLDELINQIDEMKKEWEQRKKL